MATDAALRKAGVTVEYTWDLQSCTVSVSWDGLHGEAKDAYQVRARDRALGSLRDQRLRQKARDVLERHLAGADLADWLEALGLESYDAMPPTDSVGSTPVINYERP
jgi:hypothetical protein